MTEPDNWPTVELNHLIILAKEKQKTADFLTRLFGLPDATPADGPVPDFFLCIRLNNNVTILIAEAKEHHIGHYAFKVTPPDFDKIVNRLKQWDVNYWADPRMQRPSEYYQQDGNKGLYFMDPSGHGMEVLTPLEQ